MKKISRIAVAGLSMALALALALGTAKPALAFHLITIDNIACDADLGIVTAELSGGGPGSSVGFYVYRLDYSFVTSAFNDSAFGQTGSFFVAGYSTAFSDGAQFYAWSGNSGYVPFTCVAHGRINRQSLPGPVALYCDDDTLEVWDVDPGTGEGALSFSFSAWPTTAPAVNTKLAENGRNSLWHLTSGEFQVNSFPGEGKTYAFVFNGCPYDGNGYNANIDPAE